MHVLAEERLRRRGFTPLKIIDDAFDFVCLKDDKIYFVKFFNYLKKDDVEKLQKIADTFNISILCFSNDFEHFIKPRWGRYITLKCYRCGKRSKIHLVEGLKCMHCGHEYAYRCWLCGCEFEIKNADYCTACNRFVCPKCGSCGCNEKALLLEWKRARRGDGLKVFSFTRLVILKEAGWLEEDHGGEE